MNRILFEGSTLVNSVDEDHLKDEVGILCKQLREKDSRTADAHEIKNNLLSVLKKQKYSFFVADSH